MGGESVYFVVDLQNFNNFPIQILSSNPAIHMTMVVSNLVAVVFYGPYFVQIVVAVDLAKHNIVFLYDSPIRHGFHTDRLPAFQDRGHGLSESDNDSILTLLNIWTLFHET